MERKCDGIRNVTGVRNATGEKKGPMALSFPPCPFTLPEYKTARAPRAQFCSIEIKKAIL